MCVVVVGAGVVGLAITWVLHEAGADVGLVDPAPVDGATRAAAGMLAPRSETYHREDARSRLGLAAAARYPGFVRRLEARTGRDAGFRDTQTVIVGADSADREALTAPHDLSLEHGLASKRLTTRAARRLEPLLGPGISCAFLAPHDHQVDLRTLAQTLLAGLASAGVDPVVCAAEAVTHRDPDDASSPVTGVRLVGGGHVAGDAVVLANAVGVTRLEGLPVDLTGAVRPRYSDILRLAPPPSLAAMITRTLRGQVAGSPAYVVPRADGTLVLGATTREDGRPGVSAQGVSELLREAARLVPAVGGSRWSRRSPAPARAPPTTLRCSARSRPASSLSGSSRSSRRSPAPARAPPGTPAPGTPDNARLLGALAPGLVVASGFSRNGVLLAPAAAVSWLAPSDSTPPTRPRPEAIRRRGPTSPPSSPPASRPSHPCAVRPSPTPERCRHEHDLRQRRGPASAGRGDVP